MLPRARKTIKNRYMKEIDENQSVEALEMRISTLIKQMICPAAYTGDKEHRIP